ncbi:MAG TPA: response regulator [Rhodoblastus sp.]|nr:response regulator [Rhodoblastus sp.]
MRILVIDDVAAVRESLAGALAAAGHSVTLAERGDTALELATREDFDAVVTDLWMPGMDGLDLIKNLRGRKPGLRIFAMTGGGPRLTTETASAIAEVWGAEETLIKPFDERALVRKLAQTPGG